MPVWSYDLIAEMYDIDMGANIGLDDVEFYRALVGPSESVLELGCGNGRVLWPLLQSGVDILGIDRSFPMLKCLIAKTPPGMGARVVLGDVRRLPFVGAFDVVIAPFSIVTYMISDADLTAFFASCAQALRAGGRLVVDAFIPRPVDAWAEPKLDYSRDFRGGKLERWRRIISVGNGVNRIERSYRRIPTVGQPDVFDTVDHIRPYSVNDMVKCAEASWFSLTANVDDYGQFSNDPQFRTAIFHLESERKNFRLKDAVRRL